MEVRKDFRERVAASCRTIPASALHLLIKALLPKDRPPVTREPKAFETIRREAGLPPPPAVTGVGTGSIRTRSPKGRIVRKDRARYRVLKINAHLKHNSATNRYWRAKFATASDYVDADNTFWVADAQRRLDEHFGPVNVEIGVPWLVRAGYIEII